jgi:hypothetical protein
MCIIVLVVAVASISTRCSLYLELPLASTKGVEQLQSKAVQQHKRNQLQECGVCVCCAPLPLIFFYL